MPCPESKCGDGQRRGGGPGTGWALSKFCFLPPAPGKPGLKGCTPRTQWRLNLSQTAWAPASLPPGLLYSARTLCSEIQGPLSAGLAVPQNDLILRITEAPPTCSCPRTKKPVLPLPTDPAQPQHPEFSTSSCPTRYVGLGITEEPAPDQRQQIRCAWRPLL